MTSKKESRVTPGPTHSRWREIVGVMLIAIGLLLVLSLVTYSPKDISLNSTGTGGAPVANKAGVVGAFLADFILQSLGWTGFLIPVLFLFLGISRFFARDWGSWLLRGAGGAGFMLALCVLTQLHAAPITFSDGSGIPAGGILGTLMAEGLVYLFNVLGATLLAVAGLLASILVMTNISLKMIAAGIVSFFKLLGEMAAKWRERRKRHKVSKVKEKKTSAPRVKKPVVKAPAKMKEPRQVEFATLPRPKGKFALPPLEILDPPDDDHVGISEEEHVARSKILEKKLADYGINGTITAVNPGPVITVFEYDPAPGVKVNQIVSRADDLGREMGGVNIRIVEKIPGKTVVGIEVPNGEPEFVRLREVLASEEYEAEKGILKLAIGKDTAGSPFITDLGSMPHMLVAGATGTGKSVAVNSMILSLLFNLTPEEVRFLFIDPKMLELSPYEGIPHLLAPVVMEPKKAASALRWLVAEMERRYQLLANRKARDIASYNRKVAKLKDELEEGEDPFLPHIVVIIDELADLMMTASRDVEECIARLGQMARAAGINLIIATQRPSVDTISGNIKTNITGRIAFKVFDKANSRVILDHNGAEQLLGRGDMLFIKSGMSNLVRLHGSFVGEDEVSRVVRFLKQGPRPEYRDDLFDYEPPTAAGPGDGEEDEKYQEVLDFVFKKGYASASMIQRNFKVGYNRAARMVEQMENEGIIGPPDGAKPRPVLRRMELE
jgi:S-DNA-T family DNA segregation ATPase FtsK/SpoIIIE